MANAMPVTLLAVPDYKLESIIDASANDALVELDGDVGNNGRPACICNCAIRGA
jgi:hypothetical protein